jgi:hypothetical protein
LSDDDVDRYAIALRIAILVLLLVLLLLLLLMLWRRGSGGTGVNATQTSGSAANGINGKASDSAASYGGNVAGGQATGDASTSDASANDANDPLADSDAGSQPDASDSGDSEADAAEPAERSAPRPVPTTAFIQRIEPEKTKGDASLGGAANGTGGPREAGDFFGVKLKGARVVYVVDRSSSMAGPRFHAATAELIASIKSLRKVHKFYVFFFSDGTFPMGNPKSPPANLKAASSKNIAECVRWVSNLSASGGTNPLGAMKQAIDLKPDAIFLLTDGDFPEGVVDEIRKSNNGSTVINTIAFIEESGGPRLKRIASENRGEYRFVP